MNHEALAVHARLAYLPSWGRKAAPADDAAKRQEAAEKARRSRLANADAARVSPRPGVLPPSIQAMGNRSKGRAPVGRHGFALGDAVEIVGGRYTGERGRYDGSADVARCFVMTKGGRRSVSARFVRGVAP